jgi:TPR repeat protein
MDMMLNWRRVVLAALLAVALPAAAQQEETFVEIKPGDISTDPNNLIVGAGQGDVRALNNLGLLWARGVGVPAADFKEAMRWWKEAAKRGYTLSMNNLGLLYANGHGVEQDYAQALKWWEMSAENGDAWAMNSIGDLYENGLGVERDYAQAREWYERAAEGGDGLAMYNLGSMFENGRGVDADFRRAMSWYQLSSDKGIGVAMHNLGKMIAAGRGVPADPAEAHAWLSLAATYFSPEDVTEAAENAKDLAALASTLSEQQMARAQEIAKNRRVVIEERRTAKPIEAGPGESET